MYQYLYVGHHTACYCRGHAGVIPVGDRVANSYILGLTLIIPLSPRLAARFGIRELMTASMLLFAAAAVLAGSAESFASLIFWRFYRAWQADY